MFDNVKKTIGALTDIGIGLLALAIVASLLVGLAFLIAQDDQIELFAAIQAITNLDTRSARSTVNEQFGRHQLALRS